ncbi:beta-glucuronidase isoform X2 [Acyrthosiphon pisum]|uniref:Beta-glucuronidase n=1 Tax=Acyrthosiphon pisum TaxID=7029 RepID=A0A8R2B8I2_ACYPI|nr:beta-glucuronidase isoform X2 [Acyrthosiphon pisum]|eukprot:XP_008187067.1 PREDICTED: beta-glucuronidase isoform X2 [Acyrthosiphon pisum]
MSAIMWCATLVCISALVTCVSTAGILYPRESESREVKSLDGMWNFRLSLPDPLVGFKERWYMKDLSKTGPVLQMPVPSSYNDVMVDKKIRDHVGLVWYDKSFFAPESWRQQGYRVFLRFGSVNYAAQVWVNTHLVLNHEIGHLPFQRDITANLKFGRLNRITVAVDNVLLATTVPQGSLQNISTNTGPKTIQTYTFDFFNYAGIHRSVFLYTTPVVYIDDVDVTTNYTEDSVGLINYKIQYGGSLSSGETLNCSITVLNNENVREKFTVITDDEEGLSGIIKIENAKLWWPYLMHEEPGYMYTLEIRLSTTWNVDDVYRLPVGIRTIKWTNTAFLINNKPAYLRGFGRHEDSDIRGKGMDYALVTRDYDLIKWIGANSYRTSHYPYAEEIMDFADRHGIMIVDECPSVDTDNFSDKLLKKHTTSLAELIKRDKNRPSVIMWSIANEPRSHHKEADSYFKYVVEFVKSKDKTRPVTAALNKWYSIDRAGQHLDIIGFNRYNAWYTLPGHTEIIQSRIEDEAAKWHAKHNKPVFMTEYGADSYAGLHMSPSFVWSEEYQVELMSEHFKAFDTLRTKNFFIGEMIWNFADFKTEQTVTRVGGNKKGVFTRQREPKSSAYHLRKRYWALANQLDGAQLPCNIKSYVIDNDGQNNVEL